MEKNLKKAKRLIKDSAAIQDIDIPEDGFIFKMMELAATPDNPINDVNVELLEALKKMQILLSENLPLIRGWRNSELCKMTENNPEFSQDDYNAKAAEIYTENRYASSLLKKINSFILNAEKQISR